MVYLLIHFRFASVLWAGQRLVSICLLAFSAALNVNRQMLRIVNFPRPIWRRNPSCEAPVYLAGALGAFHAHSV